MKPNRVCFKKAELEKRQKEAESRADETLETITEKTEEPYEDQKEIGCKSEICIFKSNHTTLQKNVDPEAGSTEKTVDIEPNAENTPDEPVVTED